ncbi:MAG: hypothetical protein HRT93_08895 [Piscirickettsiaceae bacterium]|nr:hypothetical protein [Piscirickettsiaceae bacterium]
MKKHQNSLTISTTRRRFVSGASSALAFAALPWPRLAFTKNQYVTPSQTLRGQNFNLDIAYKSDTKWVAGLRFWF